MKMYFKILALSLVICSHAASAQYMSVPYRVTTPGGSFTVNNNVYMPMHYGNGNSNSNPKFSLDVILKNDSVLKVKSRMMKKDSVMYLSFKHHKKERKIFPSETKQVIGYWSLGAVLKGTPTDSCWLFKCIKGAINCYSSIPINEVDYTIAIQKGDGNIIALNKKNLKEMLDTSDKKILKWLERGELTRAISRYNELSLSHR